MFYKKLYKAKNISEKDIDDFMNKMFINNALTEREAELCEGHIMENECTSIVKQMTRNKSPGFDGLTSEFYQCFWKDVKDLVINSFNEAYENGELSETHKQIVISLIFKKNDRKLFKNYRPISLSNVDYKILAFVLAKRFQKVIGKIISPEQVAYIEKRFIGQNIRLVIDVMEYAKKHNKEGILLLLDFEKAFDTLDWKFIEKCLIKMGFKEGILRWIKIIYSNPKAFLKINGFLSETINIERGIRQGCPLSCLLFIICTEFLSLLFHQNDKLEGFQIETENGKRNIKLSQYADDTCIFVKDLQNLKLSLDVVKEFSDVCGMQLNLSKTEGLCFGAIDNVFPQDNTIKWPKDPIRYLGIYIGNSDVECEKLNWTLKIEIMQKMIDCWRTRKLTLQGKILIIKTLLLPKMIFSASMLPIPEGIIKRINSILYNYIWGKTDRIQREVLINEFEKGGLCMIDVESHFMALKAAWIPRIYKESNELWKHLPHSYLVKATNGLVKEMSFTSLKQMPVMNTVPKFYQEVMTSFCQSNMPSSISNKTDLFNQILWGNRLVIVNDKCLFDKYFIEAGYIYVKDVLQENGKFKQNIFQSLKTKVKYFRVIDLIRCAIRPYKELRFKEENITESKPHANNNNKACKWFYTNIVKQKVKHAKCIRKWNEFFKCDYEWKIVTERKIKSQFQVKISEFNYKMLNNILPTGDNLFKWKKVVKSNCIYCNNESHDLQHLLWDCIHLNHFWSKISRILHVNFTWQCVLLGSDDNKDSNRIISLLCYLIYKQYLKDKEKKNVHQSFFSDMKREIEYKLKIYTDAMCDHKCKSLLNGICNELSII